MRKKLNTRVSKAEEEGYEEYETILASAIVHRLGMLTQIQASLEKIQGSLKYKAVKAPELRRKLYDVGALCTQAGFFCVTEEIGRLIQDTDPASGYSVDAVIQNILLPDTLREYILQLNQQITVLERIKNDDRMWLILHQFEFLLTKP
ncbi:MAG TPA: hypothetical protein PLV72_03785 [Candidatus Magasanikbacteria bacterium]|nr:hypothetical protein [Candidatus Magasanikbacteria bacterium]